MSLQDFGWSPFFTRQVGLDEVESLVPARVVTVHRSTYRVYDGDHERHVVTGSRWFRGETDDRPTVGDWVLLDDSRQRIERLLERKSLFKRLAAGVSTGQRAEIQLIAANVDTLFVVTSCNEEFNESRLERYLALAHESQVTPVVVLTKGDLTNEQHRFMQRTRRVSKTIPIEIVNALDAETLAGVRAWILPGQTVALVGSSGVGKSTLLNTLAGRDVQVTKDIREDDSHGRHTTTHRSLHLLEEGGLLLDVPGMRELAIADAADSLSAMFDDVEVLAQRCRFADCTHRTEPGCAVQAAIQSGELDPRRLRSYEKLMREEARNSATLAERRQQRRQFAKLVREVVKGKRRFKSE